jgi:hypothetical protein
MTIQKMALINLLLLGGIIHAAAQKADSTKRKTDHFYSSSLNFQVGYQKGNVSQLNQHLVKNGLPTLSGNNTWYNVSFNHDFDHIITEIGFGLSAPSTASSQGIETKYHQDQFFLRIGYNLLSCQTFRLYPFAGVNLSSGSLRINDDGATESVDDFSGQILNQTAAKTITQHNFGIDLGLGYDYLIKLRSKETAGCTTEFFLPIGIRAGYDLQTGAGDWKVSDHALAGGPNEKANAFFIMFSVGLGRLRSK